MKRTDMLTHLVRRTMSASLGLRRAALLVVLGDSVSVGLGVAAPLALKTVVDQVQAHPAPQALIQGEVACLVVAMLAPNMIAGFKQLQITAIVERLAATLTLDATDAAFQTTEGAGHNELAAALARLPYSLQLIVDGLASRLAPTALQLLASLIVLGAVAPHLEAALLTVTLVIYTLAVDAGYRATRRKAAQAHRQANALSHRLGDVLSHRLRILANGALALERSGLEERAAARVVAFQHMAASGARGATLQTAILLIGSLCVLALSVARVLSGHVGLGTFVLLQSYVFRLALPIGGLALILRQSDLAFENLTQVMIRSDLIVAAEPAATREVMDLDSGIKCHGVRFKYGDRALLRDLCFELPPRSFTAIVGANGSGKSTLARLMAGLLSPTGGDIELFGADASSMSAAERRRRVLYIPQFIGLFDRSIGENGVYPPARLSTSQLAERLEQWRFDPVGGALNLEDGAGPNGERLSGGQIQKLELARLTGVSTPALILDETTSALDPQTQAEAIAQLRSSAPERILLLVTHARDIAEQADQVLFLDAGSLAGFNSHRRLMRSHPAYRAFWRSKSLGRGRGRDARRGGETLSASGVDDA